MKAKVWEYQDSEKQQSHFRGYVLEYTDSPTVYRHACPEVRTSKLQAKRDADKLLKKLKTTVCSQIKTSVGTPSN